MKTRKHCVDEVVLVGAGIIGGAVAAALARERRPFTWVAPAAPTGSASHAAGAMLGALGEIQREPQTALEEWEIGLRLRAAEAYRGWLDEITRLGVEPPALGVGTFVVVGRDRAADETAAAAMESVAARYGESCERVVPRDVPDLRPAPGCEPTRALWLESEAFIDSASLCRALWLGIGGGAEATTVDDLATRLVIRDGHVVGVETRRHGVLEADETVVCAGWETQALLASLGRVETGVPPLLASKGVGLVLAPPPRDSQPPRHVLRTPNREFACGAHIVPRADGRAYVGASNRVSRFEGVTGEVTTSDVLYVLHTTTTELDTDLERWNLVEGTFGYRPLAVDGLPIAGRTRIPGLSVVCGTYRNGVLLAPVLAEVLARELDSEPDTASPLSPLNPERRGHAAQPAEILEAGLRDFSRFVRDAGSSWWHGRFDEIIAALAASEDTALEFRASILTLLKHYPRPEMVPEGLVELLQDLESSDRQAAAD